MHIPMRIAQALLYSAGAFYANPLKVPIHLLVGDSYAVGYAHFRRDHHTNANLRLHLACAVLQLLGNFGSLHALDAALGYALHPLSLCTAATWALCQLACPAPTACRVLAATAICAAYLFAPYVAHGHAIELATLCMMALAMLPGAPKSPVRWGTTLLCFFGSWLGLQEAVARFAGGSLEPQSVSVNVCLLSLMAALSLLRRPVAVSTVAGAYASRVRCPRCKKINRSHTHTHTERERHP